MKPSWNSQTSGDGKSRLGLTNFKRLRHPAGAPKLHVMMTTCWSSQTSDDDDKTQLYLTNLSDDEIQLDLTNFSWWLFVTAPSSRINAYSPSVSVWVIFNEGREIKKGLSIHIHHYTFTWLFPALILLNVDILGLLMCCLCWCEAVHLIPMPIVDWLHCPLLYVDGAVHRRLHFLPMVTYLAWLP